MIVIGVGNRSRGDDAAAGRDPWRAPDLIVLFGSDADVIVVDAMVSGARPGSITATEIALGIPPSAVPLRTQSSTHGFGVFEALELTRILGTIPARLTVIGIEGADFSPGAPLSPVLEPAVAQVADLILTLAAEEV